jgi:hypothetical protein
LTPVALRNDRLIAAVKQDPPLCALILVECLVMEDAPNGLICVG